MLGTWTSAFVEVVERLLGGAGDVLPDVLLAATLVSLGSVAGVGLGKLLEQGVNALRPERALEPAGITKFVSHFGYELDLGAVLGFFLRWTLIATFAVAALDVVGLERANQFLQTFVVDFVPRVTVFAIILIFSGLLAKFVRNIVVGTSNAAGAHPRSLIGLAAGSAVWAFGILMGLRELGVPGAFIETLFSGVVVALSLAFGLAFGLGGRDAAGRAIEHLAAEFSKEKSPK